MEQTTTDTGFEQLPLAKADIPISLEGKYRVYTDGKNYKRVDADSAVHALEASGMQKAYKIERESKYKESLILPNLAPETPTEGTA